MSTIFLRFESEAAFLALLPPDVEPAPEITLPRGSLSVIGAIDGAEGWHVNGTGEIPLSMLDAVIESPTTPMRTFA